MVIRIRPPHPDELNALSALCLRSKAHWGYDREFLAACREELTLKPGDLAESKIVVAERDGQTAGLTQIGHSGHETEILKLFVDPSSMGLGVGRILFEWCVAEARRANARKLWVEADPDARPFYERMGAQLIGTAPSGSIPGRNLPLLALPLR